jgi:hypothetical protein
MKCQLSRSFCALSRSLPTAVIIVIPFPALVERRSRAICGHPQKRGLVPC